MAPSSRSARGSRSLPRRRGIVLWLMLALALAAGALVVVALFMLLGIPRTTSGWIWTIALALLGAWIAWVSLSIGQRTSDALVAGTADADAVRGDRMEAVGRRAGKVVGGGVAKVTGRSRPEPPLAERSSDDTPAEPATDDDASTASSERREAPSLDDTARVLGQMVGRRLGGRRKDS